MKVKRFAFYFAHSCIVHRASCIVHVRGPGADPFDGLSTPTMPLKMEGDISDTRMQHGSMEINIL